ncbi:uncharacterized protein Triagg1_5434 [Trichoderma aggressivum f. europaeum]|uniref:Uncharacterized protein n=1 Tax=Trichoderma aggressivum f. europaeum TaxID=173218 RepID=A0AAE1LYH7_9HYPO|nr:hypothetical protein Triagg1_5434 [Trichoderma aggressivum f. europaeum]
MCIRRQSSWGYASSLTAKLIPISNNTPYYTEHDDYLAAAMLDLVTSQPLEMFEQWPLLTGNQLRVVLGPRLMKLSEEAKNSKREDAQFHHRRMKERQDAPEEEIEIPDDYNSDDETATLILHPLSQTLLAAEEPKVAPTEEAITAPEGEVNAAQGEEVDGVEEGNAYSASQLCYPISRVANDIER